MKLRGEQIARYTFDNAGLNLSESPYALDPSEATMVQNIDLSESARALVGRYGSKTLNAANALVGGNAYDLFKIERPTTGNVYLVCSRDDGSNFRIAAWHLNKSPAETHFHDINKADTSNFTLNQNRRVSFASGWNDAAAIKKTLVYGTNGANQPFYWDFAEWDGMTSFPFGTTNIKIAHFCPVQWNGRMWAYGRLNTEANYIYWSDSDDGTKWVDEGNSGFMQAPMDDAANPVRCVYPIRGRLTVFNLDSIGHVSYTYNPDSPYRYDIVQRGAGTLSPGTVVPWGDILVFIDKREPFLFGWNGANATPLDPDRKITRGIEQYLDFNQAGDIRMTRHGDNLRIAFDSRVDNPLSGNTMRMIAEVNLSRKNRQGMRYYPWSIYPVRCNDLVSCDLGVDLKKCYFTDTRGAFKYVHRFSEFYDGSNRFGDFNGSTKTYITYKYTTGYQDLDTFDVKKLMTFFLNVEFEGSPASGDTLKIRYQFEKQDDWSDLFLGTGRAFRDIPFPPNAYGKAVRFQFLMTSKTARPKLYDYGFRYVTRAISRVPA